MRKKLFFILFSISFLGFSQQLKKDTLYVELNADYLIDRSDLKGLDHTEISDFLEKKAHISGTHGLFLYNISDTYRGLKPLTFQSLKDIVESKKFYYPGKYNKLVNKFVLKEKLLDSFTILFVSNDLIIKPIYLEYRHLYPSGKRKLARQNPLKDSLFFKFESNFIYQFSGNPDEYYVKFKDKYDDDWFSLIKDTIVNMDKELETKSLRDFIYEIVYTTRTKRSLSDMELAEYLRNYHLFLIKGDKLIKVDPTYSIE